MRSSSSSISDRFVNETVRRIDIFSAFMESFNTGLRLPPVMANLRKRVEELESAIKSDDSAVNTEARSSEPPSVDSLIETVEEPAIKDCPHREKIERSIRELTSKVNALTGIIDDKDKQIIKLNASIVQLNTTLEEAIKRIHLLEKEMRENTQATPVTNEERVLAEVSSAVPSIDTSNFATKKELKDTEKRIIKELTDKIDAELIDAEERFDEKLKASTEAIKLALDETIGGDVEEEDEEEDIDGLIDTD